MCSTTLKNLLLNTVIIYVTFGFLIISVVAVIFPSQSYGLTIAREFWMPMYILLLFSSKGMHNIKNSLWVLFCVVFGSVGLIGNYSSNSTFLLFYGFRDILLISFFYYLLTNQRFKNFLLLDIFLLIVFVLFSIEVLSQILGYQELFYSVVRLDEYYAAKNVEISLAGGLFGQRPGFPFNSPGLISAMFGFVLLVRYPLSLKSLYLMAAIVSMSKAGIFLFVMQAFRKYYKYIIITFVLSIGFLHAIFEYIVMAYPNSIYSYHAFSLAQHIDPFIYLSVNDLNIFPESLGSNSILGGVISGSDVNKMPESIIIARIMDFNFMSIFMLAGLYSMHRGLNEFQKFYFSVFLLLLLLTGLSNQPVCYVPALCLMLKKNNEGSSSIIRDVLRRRPFQGA
jgi:hypothetical protein